MRQVDTTLLDRQLFDRRIAARMEQSELRFFADIFRALLRSKLLIILAFAVGGVATYAFGRTLEERFTAYARVMIETRTPSELGASAAGALPTTLTALESEVEVLRSLDLVERVVETLALEEDPEFAAVAEAEDESEASGIGAIAQDVAEAVHAYAVGLGLTNEDEPLSASLREMEAVEHQRTLEAVATRRSVQQLSNVSAVYEIAFTSADRMKAATIANTFAEQYLALQIAAKIAQLDRSVEWLSNRASALNERLVTLTRQLEEHALTAPFPDPASFQEARELRDEVALRMERARSQGANANVAELETAIARLNAQLEEQAAHQAEATRLESEVAVAGAVYSNVVEQLGELQERGDLLGSDARIISHARPPLSPSEPNVKLFAIGGAVGAALLAAFGVVARELSQRRLRSLSDFEEVTNLPVIGFIPRSTARMAPLKTLLIGRMPDDRLVKSARKLRASLGATGIGHQVIAGASSLPGEGKSSTLLMLGHACAEAGERTLLVDFDFWRSPYRRAISRPGPDLGALLADPTLVDDQLVRVGTSGLHVLPALGRPEAAAELPVSPDLPAFLAGLRHRYQRILIDLPPVLPVIDFCSVAASADSALLMVRWNSTPRSAVRSALRALHDVGVMPVGIVATLVRGEKAHAYSDDAFSYAHRRYLSGY